ncbi:MAG: GNAT family N-acetyltransferase [Nitrososphaerota archaeon]|nr:GNAT family N-acetyltransferase [Nitrososphaerota archaeon]
MLKATTGSKIVGSVGAFQRDETCHIVRLTLHPNFQNLEIGTRLMNEIEVAFRINMHFELLTGSKSEKNIRLYKRVDYKIFKTEKMRNSVRAVYPSRKVGNIRTRLCSSVIVYLLRNLPFIGFPLAFFRADRMSVVQLNALTGPHLFAAVGTILSPPAE